ncbi:hypothetical protein VOLCADRAFT_87932 [Volvox carteri f. nagariensis]|uniref:N-acetyltransferase domain-containing protein n=1 Tax=Volvox carteri f. nagariensis TaxID=3068 RepID=D8TMM1_VOLCA|nr:uncharacterized protein VOLCADRAFT_87932 [Volvox carteri f. nagariensis]EFJ51281.1 hypothetical protein VOLCADRAFT_87932 [Volvox carteri f. nagariensis]|eukprot:XP_002947748.1 hypothetical protein VOLCADRAFT_87932 [Volvox carteri f. nagariensis]
MSCSSAHLDVNPLTRPLSPSDEEWAERGVFLSYGKAHLSYSEVERLLQLANLDITPADFPFAAVVVWAYRMRPSSNPEVSACFTTRTQGLTGPRATTSAVKAGSSDGAGLCGLGVEVVGFACVDIAMLPSRGTTARAGLSDESCGKRGGGGQGVTATGPAATESSARYGGTRVQQWRECQRDWTPGERRRPRQAGNYSTEQQAGMAALGSVGGASSAAAEGRDSGEDCSEGQEIVATVRFLAVHPALRRQGLGRALLERLVSELRGGVKDENDAAVVTLRATSRSVDFYERLGLLRDPDAPLVEAVGGRMQVGHVGAVQVKGRKPD